jgi:hypothetical protein
MFKKLTRRDLTLTEQCSHISDNHHDRCYCGTRHSEKAKIKNIHPQMHAE